MPFFDTPEPESSPFEFDEDYSQPDWFGPPSSGLGMPVAERVFLVQRSDPLVAVTGFIAYATGLQFETVIRGTDRRVGRAMHGTFRSPYDDQPDQAYPDSACSPRMGRTRTPEAGRVSSAAPASTTRMSPPSLLRRFSSRTVAGAAATI